MFIVSIFVFSNCSSSVFTGDKSNDQLKSQTSLNQDCFGIDLSKQTLDIVTVKALLRCLNSNGSIQAYVNLVNKRMNDAQLGAFVDLVNQEILTDSKIKTLKNIHDSFDQMDQQGILSSFLKKLGEVLSNKKFISSSLKILHQGAMPHETFDPKILTAIRILSNEFIQSNGPRENIRKILEISLRAIHHPPYQEIMDGLKLPTFGKIPLRMIASRVLDYLQAKLRSPEPLGKVIFWGMADGTFFDGLNYYLHDECEGVAPSQCSSKITKLSPTFQAQGFEYFIRFLTNSHRHLLIKEQDQDVLEKMVQLYHLMDQPLFCLDHVAKVPNINMLAMQELLEQDPSEIPLWLIRAHSIKLKIATGLCDYPEGFGDTLPILNALANFPNPQNPRLVNEDPIFDHRMLTIFTHFVNGLNISDQKKPSEMMMADIGKFFNYGSENRYKRFLIDWLGDVTPKNSLLLSDMLRELTYPERHFLNNVLILYDAVMQQGSTDQQSIQYATSVLMQVRDVLATQNPEVLGTNPTSARSMYDLFSYGLVNIDPQIFGDWVEGFSEYINSPTNYLQDLLNLSRQTLLLNDVNPFLDIAIDAGRNADKNSLLVKTFLELAGTPELDDAIALTAKIAQNGDLRALLKGVLNLFKLTTDLVAEGPKLQEIPPINLTNTQTRSKQLNSIDVGKQVPWVDDASSCLKINPTVSFTDTGSSDWLNQFVNIGRCVNLTGQYPEFQRFAEYLANLQVGKKTFPAFFVDLAAELARIPPLTDRFMDIRKKLYEEISPILLPYTEAFQKFLDFTKVLKFNFWNPYCSVEGVQCSSQLTLSQGVFRVFSILSDQKKPLQNLLDLGAEAISDPYLFKISALFYDLVSDAEQMPPPRDSMLPPIDPNVIQDLKYKIKNVEFHHRPSPTETELDKIVNQKINEYWNQVLNHIPQQSYESAEDLKQTLKPLLDNLSQISNKYAPPGSTDCANGNFLECVLTFFYTMNTSPYDPQWFEKWFQRLSSDIRVIYYYYPGQYPFKDQPTVRLVNGLDLLELFVLDADFSLKETPGNFLWKPTVSFLFGDEANNNFSLRFLTMLAQCSNEPDRAQADLYYWLELLEKQLQAFEFSVKDAVLSLASAPEAQRRQFNLRQIFPNVNDPSQHNIFKKMVDHNEVLYLPDGRQLVRNDFGVLRDLFKAVLSATPASVIAEDSEVKYHKNSNSLSFILELQKIGLLRNLGPMLRYQDSSGVHFTKIAHILKTLIQLATNGTNKINPDFLKAADYLLRRDHVSDTATTFNDRYVFLGKLLDRVFEWHRKAGSFSILKQEMYDASLLMDFFDQNKDYENKFIQKIGKMLTQILSNPKALALIEDNLYLFDSLFTESKSANMLRLLVESSPYQTKPIAGRNYIESDAFHGFLNLTYHLTKKAADPQAVYVDSAIDVLDAFYRDPLSSMKQLSNVWTNMHADPEYVNLKQDTIDPVMNELLHWFVNPDGTRVLPPWLQQYFSLHLTNGDFLNLILTIGEESKNDRFFYSLQFLGRPDYVKENQDFTKFLNAGLEPNF